MPDTLFTTDAMRALFADEAFVARMLVFEAALARAEATTGVIPAAAAQSIDRGCREAKLDVAALRDAARTAGNLAIPLVAALTREVEARTPDAKGYVHWGATSQDVQDTAMVLQLREGLAFLAADVQRVCTALRGQVEKHRDTLMPGRTWLQQALPVTLGLKLAGVLDAMLRHRERLHALQRDVAVLQFGGAAGTLASLGAEGPAVTGALARELGLTVADIPWHTQRDRFCEVATTLGLLVATLGKFARDLALLSQSEVAEAFEASAKGRGGSSTLPHKRNPVSASVVLAASIRVPNLVATMLTAAVQEHERGLGNWPAEWDTLPEILLLAAGALDAAAYAVEGLEVDAARMRSNLDLLAGLTMAEAAQMALAPRLGRDVAHELVGAASRVATAQHRHLSDVLAEDSRVTAVLNRDALKATFDPSSYLGSARIYIDAVLARMAPAVH